MIKKFNNFILESNTDNYKGIIEDCLLYFCDEYDLDTHIEDHHLVNGMPIHPKIMDDTIRLAKRRNVDIKVEDVLKVSLFPKSYRHEFGSLDRVTFKDSMNDEFKKCLSRIEELSNGDITCDLWGDITPKVFNITFYAKY